MCSTEDQASSHQGVTNQATTNGKEERTAHSEEAADAGVKTLNLVYQADGVYHLKKTDVVASNKQQAVCLFCLAHGT